MALMPETKTKPTISSVDVFLDKVSGETAREDCAALVKLMRKVTGASPMMWGSAIVGFGSYHYKYESGHEGDICAIGFSPRKSNLSLYVLANFPGQEEVLAQLGKHKAGKGCLFIKKLADVDMKVLERLVTRSFDFMKSKYTVTI